MYQHSVFPAHPQLTLNFTQLYPTSPPCNHKVRLTDRLVSIDYVDRGSQIPTYFLAFANLTLAKPRANCRRWGSQGAG